MANTFKFGNKQWYGKKGSVLAYNDENNNFKPLPFDFTRSSSATRVNKDGLIEVVGSDEPRVDYLNNADGHLLLEPSRSNLITYSEDFSLWAKTRATITSNAETSPDGLSNASALVATAVNDDHFINITPVATNAIHTYSVFLKKGGKNWVRLWETTTNVYVDFNLDTGGTGSSSGTIIDNGTEYYGNGWYRCYITYNTGSAGSKVCRIYSLEGDGDRSYLGDGTTEEIYIYGAQLEAGSYATSYIPTSGSSVTRAADVCNSADVSNVIDNEGTLYIEFYNQKRVYEAELYVFTLGQDTNNVIFLRNESGANNMTARIRTSSVNQYTQSVDVPTGVNKYAVSFSSSGSKIYLNGTQVYSTSSSITIPTLSTINFNNFSSAGGVNQKVEDLRLYNTALTDSELIALTS